MKLIKRVPLLKCDDSQGILINDEILKELNVDKENTEFKLEIKNNKIILTPINNQPETLEELFEAYKGKPLNEEDKFDWEEGFLDLVEEIMDENEETFKRLSKM